MYIAYTDWPDLKRYVAVLRLFFDKSSVRLNKTKIESAWSGLVNEKHNG